MSWPQVEPPKMDPLVSVVGSAQLTESEAPTENSGITSEPPNPPEFSHVDKESPKPLTSTPNPPPNPPRPDPPNPTSRASTGSPKTLPSSDDSSPTPLRSISPKIPRRTYPPKTPDANLLQMSTPQSAPQPKPQTVKPLNTNLLEIQTLDSDSHPNPPQAKQSDSESDSDEQIDSSPSPPKTPILPRATTPSFKGPPAAPNSFTLDKPSISLINNQHDVELIPRRQSQERKPPNAGDVEEAVTITKVPKRSKGVERPKTPVSRSDTPVLRARTPVERPKTPVERPKTPSLRPRTPVDRPKTPVSRSDTPVLRPRTPVERPKTPSLRPRTPLDRPKTPTERPTTPGLRAEGRKRRKSALVERELADESGRMIEDGEKRRRGESDSYCWKCHKDRVEITCSTCVRSWHRRCIGGTLPSSDWICGECASILKAENALTRSPLIANLTMDQLCMVLKYIIVKMKRITGAEEFSKPVQLLDVSDYLNFIIKPMDLSLLESNIKSKEYGSPDAFMADAKWILHNCLVYNTEGGKYTDPSKLTTVAKQLIRVARDEISELESCPTCYIRGRHLGRPHYTWFSDTCKPPHLLVWAKLKGFPYWPAKIMPRWNQQGFVDVRFFGEHNRAWVSPKDIYLYSRDPPTATPKSKKDDIAECLREISIHIKRLGETFGRFEHAPPKTPFNPFDMQITVLLPDYDPPGGDYYRLPRRGPRGRGKKRKWDSMSDTYSEAYVYSDAETLGDFNEGDDDEDEESTVKGRETPKMRNPGRPETPGLPEASIPGKRSVTKVMRPIPSKRSSRGFARGIGMRRGTRRKTRGVGEEEEKVKPTRQLPERLNSQGRSINKRGKGAFADVARAAEPEAVREEPEDKGKIEEVKRYGRAKKSFPNKPPGIGVGGPSGQRTEASESVTPPVKTEESSWKVPGDAGPLSALLNRGADTLAKQMALVIEEGIRMAAQGRGALAGTVAVEQALAFDLKLRMERMKWEHEQEIAEVKKNSEKKWKELKTAIEAEHLRSIEEIQSSAEVAKACAILETKQKQWCTSCAKESCMYCCWNTSYCSEKCQMKDWGQHQNKCKRKHRSPAKGSTSGGRVNGQKEQSEGISGQSTFSYGRGA